MQKQAKAEFNFLSIVLYLLHLALDGFCWLLQAERSQTLEFGIFTSPFPPCLQKISWERERLEAQQTSTKDLKNK